MHIATRFTLSARAGCSALAMLLIPSALGTACTAASDGEADGASTSEDGLGGAAATISAVSAFDVTPTSAKITWTVSEHATGQVEYGATTSYGQWSKLEPSFKYSTHVQQLSGLAQGTSYHVRARSKNQAGVESISGDFTFTTGGVAASSCAPPPTSSVVVNAKSKGAKGDSATNDTDAIQAAIAAVPAGGTVLVPDGTYMIDALRSLKLKSNMTLRMTSGAALKAITNGSNSYAIINVQDGVHDVNIVGGTVQGDRATHTGQSCFPLGTHCGSSSVPGATTGMTGQWGMGIQLEGSGNVVVEDVVLKDNWGDGIYIGGVHKNTKTTICRVTADNNRRQGLSVVFADEVLVKDSIFSNTRGQMPEAGIDIEPNPASSANPNGTNVNNVRILRSTVKNNAGAGISLYLPGASPTETTYLTNVTLEGNTIDGNGKYVGIAVITAGAHRIIGNVIKNNVGGGIVMDKKASNGFVANNVMSNNPTTGILFRAGATNNTVTGNTISGEARAILDLDGHNVIHP